MIDTLAAFFKDNLIKSISVTILAIFSLFTAMWAFTDHFASAAELNRVENKFDVGQKAQSLDTQIQLNKQTIRDLDNKVSDIEDKRTLGSIDITRKERLKRQIVDIKKENDTLITQKFELEKPRKQ